MRFYRIMLRKTRKDFISNEAIRRELGIEEKSKLREMSYTDLVAWKKKKEWKEGSKKNDGFGNQKGKGQ